MSSEFPIIFQELISPTVTVHRRFKSYDEVEDYCNKNKLNIITIINYDEWLLIVASSYDITNKETIL